MKPVDVARTVPRRSGPARGLLMMSRSRTPPPSENGVQTNVRSTIRDGALRPVSVAALTTATEAATKRAMRFTANRVSHTPRLKDSSLPDH
jgi:hypothetical protein